MNATKELEEKLREYCCIGDDKSMRTLIDNGVNLNAQNAMNGWSCLHWACKRNHRSLVEYLLAKGADVELKTWKGETAVHLTKDPEIKRLIARDGDTDGSIDHEEETLPIIPNYLKNPVFPYTQELPESIEYSRSEAVGAMTRHSSLHNNASKTQNVQSVVCANNADELILKVRIANIGDGDFIEVEIEKSKLVYENLLKVCCEELDVSPSSVIKIRKLPNIIIRKDKDVSRLSNEQELELIVDQ